MLYLPAEFPLDPDLCYLNHAAIGPGAAHGAGGGQLRTAEYDAWGQWLSRLAGGRTTPARLRLARLINAGSADDIALIQEHL